MAVKTALPQVEFLGRAMLRIFLLMDDRCLWSFRGHSSIPCAVMMSSTAFPLPAWAIFQKYPF